MNVVIAHPAFFPLEPLLRERLGHRHTLRFARVDATNAAAGEWNDTHVLVTARFPASWTPLFPALQLLHAAGTGLDKIEISALPAGTRVCRSSGHGPSMAEFVMMLMLALVRDLIPAERELRREHWRGPQYDSTRPLPGSVADKTVLILGTGEIGVAVANVCHALRMHSIGVNRSGQAAAGASFSRMLPRSALDEGLLAADFLVVAVPLTDETRGLIGAHELGLLGPTGYLINVARGAVVQEEALFHALRTRALGGAALDVWYTYPPEGTDQGAPSRFPFRDLDNVIMTPHLSGTTLATFRHRAEEVAANVLALAAGKPLRNEVIRAAQVPAR